MQIHTFAQLYSRRCSNTIYFEETERCLYISAEAYFGITLVKQKRVKIQIKNPFKNLPLSIKFY